MEGEESAYDQGDATGFIRLNALRLKVRSALKSKKSSGRRSPLSLLRLDPMFDSLRDDPRFPKLAASLALKDRSKVESSSPLLRCQNGGEADNSTSARRSGRSRSSLRGTIVDLIF